MKPKQAEPDHAYNIPRLNKIFFWSSLVTLFSLVWWMGYVDYVKPWKQYQREFRGLERDKVQAGIQLEEERLAAGQRKEQMQQLEAQLAAAATALKQQQAKRETAEASLREAEKIHHVADQANRFARAVYDAYRYEFETLREHVEAGQAPHSKLEAAEKKLHELEAKKAATLAAFQDGEAQLRRGQAALDSVMADADAAQQGIEALTKEKNRLTNQLATLQPGFVNIVRNSPGFDFISPSIKIEQVVVEDLRFDVNFQTIPRVDRCHTCHMGIDKAGWEEAEQPFRSHPRPELFMTSKSPHPLERFGCSVCHDGWDRSVDFRLAAHTPQSEEQAQAWEAKYDWEALHRWDHPMLPKQYTEAACYKCHEEEVYLPGASTLNLGREVYERAGCWGCHKLEGKIGPKVGPSLRSLPSKSERDWVRHWIEDPWSFRPTTIMPRIFNLSNTSDEESLRRNDVEIAAITEYLFEKAEPHALPAMPALRGDVARGQDLVHKVGCQACHVVELPPDGIESVGLRQRFGPSLVGLRQKTSPAWVYAWIKDPKRWNPDTRMPNLRLTDQEATDITAYLMTLEAPADFGSQALPAPAPEVQDAVTLEYLQGMLSLNEAEKRLAAMSEHEKMVFLGEKLIGRYGCYACHDIPGFEKAEPIGVELTDEGSKIITRFDFGLVHEVPHTRWDWIETKVAEPRIWDRGKVKEPQEKLRMPQFNLTAAQRTAVTTFVLGLVKDEMSPSVRKNYDPHEQARNEGLRIVADQNCLACHQLQEFGGDFAKFVDDPSLAPPLLTPTGAKVQPQWLIDFVHAPRTIRPWLQVRMPTFGFERAEVSALVAMFQGISQVDERYPYLPATETSDESVRRGSRLFGHKGTADYAASLKCNSCHPSGSVLPETPPTQWGPDLSMAPERLRPEWVPQWLRNPQAIQPGTRMPNFFYDEGKPFYDGVDQDILDLRNYLWTFGRDVARARGR